MTALLATRACIWEIKKICKKMTLEKPSFHLICDLKSP